MTAAAPARPVPAGPAAPAPGAPARGRLRVAARTLGLLALLQVALPANLLLTGAALVRGALAPGGLARRTALPPGERRTVMVSGGKMTKSLQLARSFAAAGHRVVMVETAGYRWTGHRASRAVDAFHVVPDPTSPGYAQGLLDVVLAEGVDVFVPVDAPAASLPDALAAELLAPHCEVVHARADLVAQMDDKAAFPALASSLGLPVPETHRVTSAAEVLAALDAAERAGALDADGRPQAFVLKSIAYDPVNRLDLTPLPRATRAATEAFAASKPISAGNPWILQALVRGQELCTHTTARGGAVQVWACCPSSPFQVNYEMVEEPAVEAWVRRFVGELGITGQVALDVIKDSAGAIWPIECNPRTHSAVTMFYDSPDLARAYLEDGVGVVRPTATSRPTHWLYQEAWRLLAEPGRRARLRSVLAGHDAVFAWDDPLPFLLLHHRQLPVLLWRQLRSGRDWVRVDVNIGKVVQAAGD